MKYKMPTGFWKNTIKIAIPIALQNLLISCGSLIDTAMIVRLGDTAVAAVGVAGRFTFMLNLISFGIASGLATLVSQYWGVKDKKGIQRSYGFALSVAMSVVIVYSLILFLFTGSCVKIFGAADDVASLATEYLSVLSIAMPCLMYSQISCSALRATEKLSVPLVSSFVGVGINTGLNYCLIYGNFGFPKLGVKGAAIATAISYLVQALIVFFFIKFSDNIVRGKIKDLLNFDKVFVKKYFNAAAPVLLNETMWGLGSNIYAMILARQATSDYAAYSVFGTIEQLFFVFFVGLCNASAIMVGKTVGRGSFENAFQMAKRYLIATPIAGAVIGIIVILVRKPILSLLSIESQQTFETAANILLVYGIWLGFRMIPYTAIVGIFRAGGDTKTGCIFELSSMYLIAIPALAISAFVLHLPFVALVAVMYIGEDLPKTILSVKHLASKKWMKRLTDD